MGTNSLYLNQLITENCELRNFYLHKAFLYK